MQCIEVELACWRGRGWNQSNEGGWVQHMQTKTRCQCCQDCEFTCILAQVSKFGGPAQVTRSTNWYRSGSKRGATRWIKGSKEVVDLGSWLVRDQFWQNKVELGWSNRENEVLQQWLQWSCVVPCWISKKEEWEAMRSEMKERVTFLRFAFSHARWSWEKGKFSKEGIGFDGD